MPAFLDPNRPVHTCNRTSCEGCDVQGKVTCHFNQRQLFSFLLGCLPAIAAGIWIAARVSIFAVLGWVACFLSFFGLLEIRVMYSHCPHYAEPETSTLKCWANYGSPKLWKYRPGPMSVMETALFFLGLVTVSGYPIVFAALTGQFVLLIVYTVLMLAGVYALRRFLCVKCFNFACPLNRVPEETREPFFACNPVVREAWRKPE